MAKLTVPELASRIHLGSMMFQVRYFDCVDGRQHIPRHELTEHLERAHEEIQTVIELLESPGGK